MVNSRGQFRNSRRAVRKSESAPNFEAVKKSFVEKLTKDGFLVALAGFFSDGFRFLISIFKYSVQKLRDELWADSRAPLKLDGLEKTRRHKPDYLLVLFMGLIMVMGVIMMYALSPQRADFLNKNHGGNYGELHFFYRQLMSLGFGIVAFVAVSKIPLQFIYRHAGKILAFGFISCLLLAILGLGQIWPAGCKLGACRWFEIGPISIQPSEFLKLGLLIALATFLGVRAKEGKINNLKDTIIPAGLLIAAMFVIVAGFQKDLGTAISALAIVAFQFFVAGLSKRNIIVAMVILVILAVGAILVAPHRMSRVMTFLGSENCSDLSSEDQKEEYHICHAKIAIGSGGLVGVGIGNSVQATGYLPESINDSIFAILGETFGFVGLVVILAIFLALIVRILFVSSRMKNPASRILTAGVCGWFAFHTIMNVSAMIGILPLTGITMPLISYGGTSIVFISAALGLVFNISAYTSFTQINDFYKEEDENSRGRGRLGRTRYSSRRRI